MESNKVTYRGRLEFNLKDITAKHVRQSSWKKTGMITLRDDSNRYYRWFLERRFPFIEGLFETPKSGGVFKDSQFHWINLSPRGPHMTIINDKLYDSRFASKAEQKKWEDKWNQIVKKYSGKVAEFTIDVAELRTDGVTWWYKVQCPIADQIRAELGIGDPYYGYHFTVGEVAQMPSKVAHSEYLHKLYKKGFLK